VGAGDPEVLVRIKCGKETGRGAGVGPVGERGAGRGELRDGGRAGRAEVGDPGVVRGVDGDGVRKVEAATSDAVAGEDFSDGAKEGELGVGVVGNPDVADGVDCGEVGAVHVAGVEGDGEG